MIDVANFQTTPTKKPRAVKKTVKPNESTVLTAVSTVPKFYFTKISVKDKLFFVQNLQIMVKNGLALDKSLMALAEQTINKRLKAILEELSVNTQRGLSFSDSLAKHADIFGDFFINMVKAGELSGSLDKVLEQVYLQIKKMYSLRSKIVSAMIYPIIVITAMIGIGIGMVVFIIPKITDIFTQSNVELPVTTRTIIAISDFFINHGILLAVAVVVLIFIIILILKQPSGRRVYHNLLLKLPIAGEIIKKINLAKFCRTFSSLIKTDIPIASAFAITAQVLGNGPYADSLNNSLADLKTGTSVTNILKKYPHLYPPIVIQMSSAGEETGTIGEIFSEIADFYEDEIDQTMKNLPAIIEPVLILILGVAVGLMAISIITPMYSLTNSIN
jgi:type IV pilus assembly protein PilC